MLVDRRGDFINPALAALLPIALACALVATVLHRERHATS